MSTDTTTVIPASIYDQIADGIGATLTLSRNKIAARWHLWLFKRFTHKFEHELAKLIELANGHQARGLPPGSQAYVELYKQANDLIGCFCEEFDVDRASIEAMAPALRGLEGLTRAPSPVHQAGKGLGMILMVILGAILIGAIGGFVFAGFQWAAHLLVR